MVQRYPAPEQAEGQAPEFDRIRRYETARLDPRDVLRALPLATLTALLVALLLAAAIDQALAPGAPEHTAGTFQDAGRPVDTFDWEQWDRARLAPYQPADTFDWEQWERAQTGTGTTGDAGPCRKPWHSCDR